MAQEVGMTEKIRAIGLVAKLLGRTVRSIGIGAWQGVDGGNHTIEVQGHTYWVDLVLDRVTQS